ncbi:hypothetical protein K491DRAFT_715104 [Lophiostoma macrostomum CBS 122681]|uniref:F-box domain-containing protein n=1 Tax=Lophiostoma macrostomum CBS 122681 TaxID=1314788 RepID=A0A6A6TBM3_9PLEO|nr:hypothetical protein K491DRAFT_715104 [Lophiostoma macrostomum CBS 122681]
MDDLLPSYESVIQQNPWELVAPYLSSSDLCSAALACQKWHGVFTPQLWGAPASHFGVQNDTVYVALTRFKRTLYWSRACVRQLTHTLHLPPAHAEIYGGPHSEWLRDCLERLPRLQSLIVNGLPFFDHASLLTLRHSSSWWRSSHPNLFPVFSLRLLDASGCSNTTSTGLAEALPHFPDLVSLDLSRTSAARDETLFRGLKYLRNLRILKLRGLGLKDDDLLIIASSIRTRVRSLDVSENLLTDASARALLEHCIKATTEASYAAQPPRSPIEDARPLEETDIFGTENLDNHLRNKLTQGFVGSLAVENARDAGITHLYLTKNCMTVEGISGLLRSTRLQALDAGTLASTFHKPHNPGSEEDEQYVLLPGVEKLTPVLAEFASQELVYLRMNYSVVTEDAPLETVPSPRAEAEGDGAVYTAHDAHELPALEPPLPELDSTEMTIHELPVDGSQIVELPVSLPTTSLDPNQALPNSPAINITPDSPEIKRGPAYAPEVVIQEELLSPISPIVDASGGLSPLMANFSEATSPSSTPTNNGQLTTRPRSRSTLFVEDRRAALELRQSHEQRLHPGMLPKVHTLVLTDVPSHTDNSDMIRRLIQFIQDCAEEVTIANMRARHTYILPPGRTRAVAEREYARSLFALKRIVLEIAPPQAAPKKISTTWRQYPTKSSTEDTDSEAFWQAAAHDFSFFGDEECGLPNAEPNQTLPLAMSGLMLASEMPARTPRPAQAPAEKSRLIDVVAEIAAFRKERKAAYQAAVQYGAAEPVVNGYWPGDITVVRRPVNPDAGELDFYGNQYESNGWLYR